MKLLVFGEILYDVIGSDAFFGGAPANVCGHMAMLGGETLMLSRIGSDRRGQDALAQLKKIGVNTGFVTIDPSYPTGEVLVTLSQDGIPDYDILKNQAYDFIQYTDEDIRSLQSIQFDCFYFGTLNQRHPVARKTLQELLKNLNYNFSFYDINLRKECYSKETIDTSMQKADIFKINDEELLEINALFGYGCNTETESVSKLFEKYPYQVMIVTKGKAGATIYTRTDSQNIPVVPAKVADTVGAGDAFCAAFIKYYAQTKNPFFAARAGNLLGSYVAGKRGALPAYDNDLKNKLKELEQEG